MVEMLGKKPTKGEGLSPCWRVVDFLVLDKDKDGLSKSRYQSMIGAAQWVINLGRFDSVVHVI